MNRKYRLFNVLIVALLLLAALSFPTANAYAITEGPGQLLILGDLGTPLQCFQVGNSPADTQDNIALAFAPCQYDNTIFQPAAHQSFTIEYVGPGSAGDLYAIRVKHSNKCLWVKNSSTSTGAAIVQKPCTTGTAWYIESTFSGSGRAKFRAHHSNKCMSGNTVTGGPITQGGTCNSDFRLLPAGIGVRVRSFYSFKCLDVDNSGGGLQNNAILQQWDCLGYNQTNQRWNIEIDPAFNEFKIRMRALHSGKCMHTSGLVSGNRVVQYTCSNTTSQWWYTYYAGISPAGPRFKLSTMPPYPTLPRALDLDTAGAGAGLQNGAKIQVWDILSDAQLNQTWIFKQLTP